MLLPFGIGAAFALMLFATLAIVAKFFRTAVC